MPALEDRTPSVSTISETLSQLTVNEEPEDTEKLVKTGGQAVRQAEQNISQDTQSQQGQPDPSGHSWPPQNPPSPTPMQTPNTQAPSPFAMHSQQPSAQYAPPEGNYGRPSPQTPMPSMVAPQNIVSYNPHTGVSYNHYTGVSHNRHTGVSFNHHTNVSYNHHTGVSHNHHTGVAYNHRTGAYYDPRYRRWFVPVSQQISYPPSYGGHQGSGGSPGFQAPQPMSYGPPSMPHGTPQPQSPSLPTAPDSEWNEADQPPGQQEDYKEEKDH